MDPTLLAHTVKAMRDWCHAQNSNFARQGRDRVAGRFFRQELLDALPGGAAVTVSFGQFVACVFEDDSKPITDVARYFWSVGEVQVMRTKETRGKNDTKLTDRLDILDPHGELQCSWMGVFRNQRGGVVLQWDGQYQYVNTFYKTETILKVGVTLHRQQGGKFLLPDEEKSQLNQALKAYRESRQIMAPCDNFAGSNRRQVANRKM